MSTPLLGATEAELRRDRTSVKWVAYPPDVLPLWVAEMDAAPCPAVARGRVGRGAARRHRLRVGPALRRRGRAVRPRGVGLGGRHLGGDDRARRDDRRRRAAPAAHRRGRPGRGLAAGLRLVLRVRRRHRPSPGRRPADRRRSARPRGAAHRVPGGDRGRRAGGLPAVQPAQPDRHGALPRRARLARGAGRGARGAGGRRRDPRAAGLRRRPGLHALPHRAGGRARLLGVLALEGVEPRRPEVGPGDGRAAARSTTSRGCTR